jgi:hypothetical protein
MRKVTAGALAVALVFLGSWGLNAQETAQAQGTVDFDIDPEITGNSASTLGTVEDCVQVDVPSPSFDDVSDYEIDIVVSGDTQAPTMYDVSLNFDSNKVHIAEPGTNRLIKLPEGLGLGETLPDRVSPYVASASPFMGEGIAGDGTLMRIGLDIGASGVVVFSLNAAPQTAYKSDAGSHPFTLDSGRLAINDSCAIPPVGGVAELPDVSELAGHNYVGLAGLAAVAAGLAAGGWYARRRLS